MITSIQEWLSVNLIALGLRLCPYREMEQYLRQGLNMGIESYFSKQEDKSEN